MCLDLDIDKYINAMLIKALGTTTLSDLHYYLYRYHPKFKTEKEVEMAYPKITMDLVMAVLDAGDECPVCYKRFLKLGVNHKKSCKLGQLLANNKKT